MALLKHIIAWPTAWCLFWLGHACSVVLRWLNGEYWTGFWYMCYNNLMVSSTQIQDWADGQDPRYPWGRVNSGRPD